MIVLDVTVMVNQSRFFHIPSKLMRQGRTLNKIKKFFLSYNTFAGSGSNRSKNEKWYFLTLLLCATQNHRLFCWLRANDSVSEVVRNEKPGCNKPSSYFGFGQFMMIQGHPLVKINEQGFIRTTDGVVDAVVCNGIYKIKSASSEWWWLDVLSPLLLLF